MNHRKVWLLALTVASVSALAQTNAATTTQRDVNQQTRIENGLQSGALTTREAAKLEKEESQVSRLQARSLQNGSLSPAERARLNAAQNKVSRDITAQTHDAQTGHPQSASSQRMQADVARNLAEEKRIHAGLKDGSLTRQEAGSLEQGQAATTSREAQAGRDGHVGVREQAKVQASANRQSKRIYQQRHDAQVKG
jgi:hypothetical protein